MRELGIAVGQGLSEKIANKTTSWEKIKKVFSKHDVLTNRTDGKHFVGGHFKNDHRNNENLLFRSMLAIDIDKSSRSYESLLDLVLFNIDDAFLLYTTYRSTPEHPRVRILVPLDRDVTGEEYRVLSKAYCDRLIGEGIDGIDEASHKPSQFMFYPASEDGTGSVYIQDGDFLPVDSFDLTIEGDSESDDGIEIKEPDFEKPSESIFLSALNSIPNEGEGLDYDQWFNVLCGIKNYFGGDAGKAVAMAFTDRSDKNKNATKNFDTTWRSIDPNRHGKGKGITYRTILGFARTHGWSDDVMEGFEIVKSSMKEDTLSKLSRKKNGRIENTAANCNWVIADPDLMGMRIAFDEFKDEILFSRANGPWQSFGDSETYEIRIRLDEIGFVDTSIDKTRGAIHYVAWKNRFDSAQLWLNSLKWDGVPRIRTFLRDYFGAEDSNYTHGVSNYMWSAMAGRIISPGIKADMVPVLVSPEGRRKSSAVEAMAPQKDLFTELNLSAKDNDISRQLRGKIVAEWAELGGMSRKEVEHVKGFITRKCEEWTPKFKEYQSKYARRCIFIGTTNNEKFLVSDTGNRRFLPLVINHCFDEEIAAIRDQLWAEAAAVFNTQGVLWQEAHELGAEFQKAHMEEDAWEEIIGDWLDQDANIDLGDDFLEGQNGDRKELTCTLIAKNALNLTEAQMNKMNLNRIGRVLRALDYENKPARIDGKLKKVWRKMEKLPF